MRRPTTATSPNSKGGAADQEVAAARAAGGRGGLGGLPKLLSLGRDMVGLSTDETRSSTTSPPAAPRKSSTAISRAISTKALFGFDGVVGNFASPQSPGTAYVLLHHLFGEAAGVPGRLGPCDRRHGRDHPGDGPRVPRGRRRHPSQHAGRGGDRRPTAARPAWSPAARRGGQRRSLRASIRSCCSTG